MYILSLCRSDAVSPKSDFTRLWPFVTVSNDLVSTVITIIRGVLSTGPIADTDFVPTVTDAIITSKRLALRIIFM